MIYYRRDGLTIRNMESADPHLITEAELAQGWDDADIAKYETRLSDQAAGRCVALVAECDGRPVGYINVYPVRCHGPFAGSGFPEIVDFGVIEKYRRRGIGGRLMDVAERIAGRYAHTVFLGVGLHSGYGNAQRMYVKRGYVPDGSGVWYKDRPCTPYDEVRNDDELVLYLSKRLKRYDPIALRQRPELAQAAAEWFHERWGVPAQAYRDCMDAYLAGRTEYGWYLCLDGDRIVGGLGVIENDFHDCRDLAPNICAVYTDPSHRGRGIARRLLDLAVSDLRAKGISPVYLVTDHVGFYERYGWRFLCMARDENTGEETRVYVHD